MAYHIITPETRPRLIIGVFALAVIMSMRRIKKMNYVIVRLFGLWHVAAFENGVMQYSIYGGYKREQDAKRQATIHGIKISEVRR